MEDLARKNTCGGVNGQTKTDESPSPAAGSVDSCCRSCLTSIILRVSADYKNETVKFLKTGRTRGKMQYFIPFYFSSVTFLTQNVLSYCSDTENDF